MPTAVERLLQAFLKLEIDNPFEQRGLAVAFSHIDSELLAIGKATNSHDLIKAERAAARDVFKIADAFHDTGEDLSRIARGALQLDRFLVKLNAATPSVTATAATGDGGIPLQDDFLKLESLLDLTGIETEKLGADIWKMNQSVRVADFVIKWHQIGDDAATLAKQMGDDQAAFERLSDDFLKLADVNADGKPANVLDYNLGNALHKIAGDFAALERDVFDIKIDFSGDPGGGVPVANVFATEAVSLLSPGAALSHANTDFLKLSDDFVGLAGPAAAGIGALVQRAFGGGGGTAFP